jgi:FHA domain-containing protein
VTETGLLIAEAAFLVLLFAFVWSIVRSSTRNLHEAEPVVVSSPPAGPGHGGDTGSQVSVAPRVGDSPIPAQVVAPDPGSSRERPTGPVFELSQNIAPVLIVTSSPSLASELKFPLEAGLTLGRSRSSGIPVSDQFASHMHARVYPKGHFFFIEDLGSTNGTFVNGRRIDGQTQLKVHDEIRLGETVFRYEE